MGDIDVFSKTAWRRPNRRTRRRRQQSDRHGDFVVKVFAVVLLTIGLAVPFALFAPLSDQNAPTENPLHPSALGQLQSGSMVGTSLSPKLRPQRQHENGHDEANSLKLGGTKSSASIVTSTQIKLESLSSPVPHHGIPIWVFFYLWYGTPEMDGKYWHWTHPILPHWDKEIASKWPRGTIEAPEHVASPGGVKPMRGLYSSRNFTVLSDQMKEIRQAGIAGCIVSWWGRNGGHDDHGPPTEPDAMSRAFRAAERNNVRIAVHLEPYPKRTMETVCDDLSFLLAKYGKSTAWDSRIFVYDAYLTSVNDWSKLRTSCHEVRPEIRLITLILKPEEITTFAMPGKFDGVYTYFAASGFTQASNPKTWNKIASMAHHSNLEFIPCIGPGYDDTTIRPWNHVNTHNRNGGSYMRQMWNDIPRQSSSIEMVAITSYNEWGEGTMIEPTEADDGLYMDTVKGFQW